MFKPLSKRAVYCRENMAFVKDGIKKIKLQSLCLCGLVAELLQIIEN
jgi:hypothetical protein